jgi:Ion channel
MIAENFRQIQDRYRDPMLTALTVMLAIFLFVVAPMQAAGVPGVHLFAIAFGLVLIAAVFIISGSGFAVAPVLAAEGLIVLATVLRRTHPSDLDIILDAAAWLIAGITLCIVISFAVFARGQVNYHRVIGAVLLYFSIGLIFAALFCFVATFNATTFAGIGALHDNLAVAGNLIYFSFVTLTSVGYGDIVPVHPYARGLANVEAIIGQLYPATLLARLVTLELERRHHSR